MALDSSRPNSDHTVGYLGPHGTYSEEVAFSLYQGKKTSFRPFTSIYEAIRAVESGEINECIVPVENSIEGSVNVTLDTLAHEVNLYITQEIAWSVRHNLLVKGDMRDIRVVVSHPQALAQCRRNLATLYPNAVLKGVESSAEAATIVASGIANHAAVGSQNATKIYDLNVIAADIQDSSNNCTRFIVLSRQPATLALQENYKTSVVCQINGDKPGMLCDILQEFVSREVNLTRIESRPARTGIGKYIFFFDIEGGIDKSNVCSAIEAVKLKSLWFKNFGSYPVFTEFIK